jgi:hypothetical protein
MNARWLILAKTHMRCTVNASAPFPWFVEQKRSRADSLPSSDVPEKLPSDEVVLLRFGIPEVVLILYSGFLSDDNCCDVDSSFKRQSCP